MIGNIAYSTRKTRDVYIASNKDYVPHGKDEGWNELAKMVVVQAFDDYRMLAKKYAKPKYHKAKLPKTVYTEKRDIEIQMEEIEEFLGSSWAEYLSGIRSEILLDGLSPEFMNVNPKKAIKDCTQATFTIDDDDFYVA